MGVWTAADQDVFTGTCDLSWRDLDLSSVVGSNMALCLFGVMTSSDRRVAVRRKGLSFDCRHIDSSTHGMHYTYVEQNHWHTIACLTDVSGVIQHQESSTSADLTIRLLGYNIISNPGPIITDASYDFPISSWTTYDISSEQGALRALAFMNYGRVDGFGSFAVRTPGDTRDSVYVNDSQGGGANRGSTGASGKDGCLVCVETNTSGVFEHSNQYSPAATSPIYWEGSEVDNYVQVGQTLSDFVPVEDDWQDIDISTYVPNRALCLLLIERGDTGTQDIELTTRRKGETRDFSYGGRGYGPGYHKISSGSDRAAVLLVETSDTGIVELYTQITTPASNIRITIVGYIASKIPLVCTPSYLGLRVTFPQTMFDDDALRDPASYAISPTEGGAVSNYVLSVTPEEDTFPVTHKSYVDLECTDLTHGKGYILEIAGSTLKDANEIYVDANDGEFTGVSEIPDIQSLVAESETTMRLVFTKQMAITDDLLDPTRYVFDKGLTVQVVTSPSPGVVMLQTTKQTPSEYYTLTVS